MPDGQETLRVEITKDGPYRVHGGAALVRTAQVETEYGEPVDWEPDDPIETQTTAYDLCRCGNSSRPSTGPRWRHARRTTSAHIRIAAAS